MLLAREKREDELKDERDRLRREKAEKQANNKPKIVEPIAQVLVRESKRTESLIAKKKRRFSEEEEEQEFQDVEMFDPDREGDGRVKRQKLKKHMKKYLKRQENKNAMDDE
jgi:hypothetical protein